MSLPGMKFGDIVYMTSCEVVYHDEKGVAVLRQRFTAKRGAKMAFLMMGSMVNTKNYTEEMANAAMDHMGFEPIKAEAEQEGSQP